MSILYQLFVIHVLSLLTDTVMYSILHLECFLLSPKRHIKINKQTKRCISMTKKSDTSITVIYHGMSLTVLYVCARSINFPSVSEIMKIY
jgi:hypothetical protein